MDENKLLDLLKVVEHSLNRMPVTAQRNTTMAALLDAREYVQDFANLPWRVYDSKFKQLCEFDNQSSAAEWTNGYLFAHLDPMVARIDTFNKSIFLESVDNG